MRTKRLTQEHSSYHSSYLHVSIWSQTNHEGHEGLIICKITLQSNITLNTCSCTFAVTYSSTSPRPSAVDVSAELLHPENKAKQLQTLQVPIPVGEVSPVSLKRSPGPAIHSGLPSVLSMIGPGIKTQGSVSSHPSIRPGLITIYFLFQRAF